MNRYEGKIPGWVAPERLERIARLDLRDDEIADDLVAMGELLLAEGDISRELFRWVRQAIGPLILKFGINELETACLNTSETLVEFWECIDFNGGVAAGGDESGVVEMELYKERSLKWQVAQVASIRHELEAIRVVLLFTCMDGTAEQVEGLEFILDELESTPS